MKRILFIITFIFTLSITIVSTPTLAAGDFGLGATAGAAGLSSYNKPVPELIGNIIGTALSLIAVLFFVITVYGGILWMTARGKEDQSKKALDTIIAAVIGIIIVLGAYALTNLVFDSLKGGRSTKDNPISGPTLPNDLVSPGDPAPPGDPQDQMVWLACNCLYYPDQVVLGDNEPLREEECFVDGPQSDNINIPNRCGEICEDEIPGDDWEDFDQQHTSLVVGVSFSTEALAQSACAE